MALGHTWAGKAYGTNIGNVFLKLEGKDDALAGTLRMNEPGVAIAVYAMEGTFDGSHLALKGEAQVQIDGVEFGQLTVAGELNDRGELHGEWETTVGTAGTFILFPHDEKDREAVVPSPEQFHTARHNFGAIEIDRDQIISLAEDIRRDFPKVVVTVLAGTEQSRYLDDFKQLKFSTDRAEVIKVFAQAPDGSGGNRVVSVEFGPQYNLAMTQGASEAWVLGRLETLKRDLRRYEQAYTTNFKRWGIGINQLLILGALVFLPSLGDLLDRAILMAGVLALVFGVNWFHSHYLPFAAIYLTKKPVGLLTKIGPSVVSWLITILAGAAATLLALYLQGWLDIPTPSEPTAITRQ